MSNQYTLADFNIDSTNMVESPIFTFVAPVQAQPIQVAPQISAKLAFAYIKSTLQKIKRHYNMFNHLFHKRNLDNVLPNDLIIVLYNHLLITSKIKGRFSVEKLKTPQWMTNPLYWKYIGLIYYFRHNKPGILRTCFEKMQLLINDDTLFCSAYPECAYTLADLYNPDEGLLNDDDDIAAYKIRMRDICCIIVNNTRNLKLQQMVYSLYALNSMVTYLLDDGKYKDALNCIMALEKTDTAMGYMYIAHARIRFPQIIDLMDELKIELNAHCSSDPCMRQFIASRKYKVGKCCICFGMKRLYKHDCLNEHGVCICCYGKTTTCPLCRFKLDYIRDLIIYGDDGDYNGEREDDSDSDSNSSNENDERPLRIYY